MILSTTELSHPPKSFYFLLIFAFIVGIYYDDRELTNIEFKANKI